MSVDPTRAVARADLCEQTSLGDDGRRSLAKEELPPDSLREFRAEERAGSVGARTIISLNDARCDFRGDPSREGHSIASAQPAFADDPVRPLDPRVPPRGGAIVRGVGERTRASRRTAKSRNGLSIPGFPWKSKITCDAKSDSQRNAEGMPKNNSLTLSKVGGTLNRAGPRTERGTS
jgi:hypothetical protein